jgi:hypothetical protein
MNTRTWPAGFFRAIRKLSGVMSNCGGKKGAVNAGFVRSYPGTVSGMKRPVGRP